MALEEVRYVKQVTVKQLSETDKAAEVQWGNAIVKDGTPISETYERKAYTEEQKADFLAEVEGAANYLAALGWI